MPKIMIQEKRKVFSVSEITRDIRSILEETFYEVWVEGEVSNYKFHSSGHMYFALKDENAQIQCVMFRSDNARVSFQVEEGLKVIACGRISVYPVRGQYQLYVEKLEPQGLGALALRFEALKEKLKNEGLFDEAHKKPIPYLPSRIGLVTSIDGAAMHDILNVFERRFSQTHVIIYPVSVQGPGAAESIAEAIRDFNTLNNVDVLIVGRGGGSLEDLWAFNEEVLARAIYQSQIPVISAVGHEVDFTIADFVSDLRAATPSAAAEMVMPKKADLLVHLSGLYNRMNQEWMHLFKELKNQLEMLKNKKILKNPLAIFDIQFQKLDELKKNIHTFYENQLGLKKEKVLSLINQLHALGPSNTLKRGFSVTVKHPEETVINSYRSVKRGQIIKTKLKEGFLISQVKETHA